MGKGSNVVYLARNRTQFFEWLDIFSFYCSGIRIWLQENKIIAGSMLDPDPDPRQLCIIVLCQGCVENYSQEVWRKHSKSTFMLMYHTVRKSMLCFVFLRYKFLAKLTWFSWQSRNKHTDFSTRLNWEFRIRIPICEGKTNHIEEKMLEFSILESWDGFSNWRLLHKLGSPSWRPKNKYIAIFDQKCIHFIATAFLYQKPGSGSRFNNYRSERLNMITNCSVYWFTNY